MHDTPAWSLLWRLNWVDGISDKKIYISFRPSFFLTSHQPSLLIRIWAGNRGDASAQGLFPQTWNVGGAFWESLLRWTLSLCIASLPSRAHTFYCYPFVSELSSWVQVTMPVQTEKLSICGQINRSAQHTSKYQSLPLRQAPFPQTWK